MPGTCIHGFDPADCLICRTLAPARPSVASEPERTRHRRRVAPAPTALPSAPPVRPDTVYSPSASGTRRGRSLGTSLVLVLMALLAIGAAIWILAGVVFTVLHLLELIVVAGGAGWVGYRIGHFKGARHPRSGG